MIEIDGSQGEGGGQVLRSSLALSIVTRQPVKLTKIRAKRSKPGLMRQHLTSVKAAAEICSADVSGAELKSRELTFRPGKSKCGEYSFRIGTAGSTGLVLQTVLPALLCADGPSTVKVEGGTYNPKSPPFDFLQRCYLPLVNKLGPVVKASLNRPGFYPAGGGEIKVEIQPAKTLRSLELSERGKHIGRQVTAIVAHLPEHIGTRECNKVTRGLQWSERDAAVVSADDSRGPGNALMAELQFANVTELFTSFGETGKRAERVGQEVLSEVKRYLKSDAPVGEYLADQLLLPLAIGASQGTGGGVYRTNCLSLHTRTHIEVIQRFLDVNIKTTEHDRNNIEVSVFNDSPGA